MATTLDQAISQVRSVHPAFSRYMVPDKALADFFTQEQQRLMTVGLQRDRGFLAQSLPILFDVTNADADAPGTAGVSSAGGVPAALASDGTVAGVQQTAGVAVTESQSVAVGSETAVASATTNTLTGVGVSWTASAYAGKSVLIVAGTGQGQSPRTITANTTTQVTISGTWETTPDPTSVFRIVTIATDVDGTTGMVTDVPNLAEARGYLVKLDPTGQPYVDYTAPVIGHTTQGVPLPPYHAILSGIVRYLTSGGVPSSTPQTDYNAIPLTLVQEASRYAPQHRPAAYIQNNTLYLVGNRAEWQYVESIELRYVPIPPPFTSRSQYFLLPDTAIPALVAGAAVFAASRIYGLPNVPQMPTDVFALRAQQAQESFIHTIGLTTRARVHRVRPGWR